jgi:hypothetical protein
MNSHRCHYRWVTITPTPQAAGVDPGPVRPRQGRDGLVGFRVRRFHLRLFTVPLRGTAAAAINCAGTAAEAVP